MSGVAFSPDSRQLILADHGWGEDRTLEFARLWDVQTGELVGSLRGHSGAIEAVQFSANGSLIATASTDGTARLWATEMGSEFPILKTMNGQIQWAAFRRPAQALPLDQPPSLTAMPQASLLSQSVKVQSVKAPSDNGFGGMVTVAIDGTLSTWNPVKPMERSSHAARTASVPPSQAWYPARLTGMNGFNFLSVFGTAIGPALKVLQPAPVESASVISEPLPQMTAVSIAAEPVSYVASATADQNPLEGAGTPRTPERLLSKLPSGMKLTGVAFSDNTQLIATATVSGSVEVWQTQPDHFLKRLRRLNDLSSLSPTLSGSMLSANQAELTRVEPMRQLAFSPDGRTLLGVGDRVIYLWDIVSGKLIQRLQGHEASIEQAQFSADSQRVVSASRDHTARLWQIASGQLLTTLYHRDVVSSAHFSPDGRLVAIASWDGTARVLDATTGALRVVMAGHHGAVLDAEFSPDATNLVTASADGTVRLWDAKTGTEQALLRSAERGATQEQIQQAFFSPDGRYVASLSKRGDIHLWAATWEELLHLARDRSLRQLQPEECLRYLRLSPNACPDLEKGGEG